jgi:hypothetical protein
MKAEFPFSEYKFRCSSLGSIMSASGKITQGNITELKKIYHAQIKGFKEEISSKYFEKGKFCEEDGISMLQKTIFHNIEFPLVKNKERKENEFISGEHDVKVGNVIVDIKNCFNWKTLDDAEVNDTYDYQLAGYMDLNNCDEAILFYCLVNMPEHMMVAEERKLFYSGTKYLGFEDPEFTKDCAELRERFNFEKFPIWERFKSFHIAKDKAKIESVYEKIKMCRNWLNQYHLEQLSFYEKNKSLMGLETAELVA